MKTVYQNPLRSVEWVGVKMIIFFYSNLWVVFLFFLLFGGGGGVIGKSCHNNCGNLIDSPIEFSFSF